MELVNFTTLAIYYLKYEYENKQKKKGFSKLTLAHICSLIYDLFQEQYNNNL